MRIRDLLPERYLTTQAFCDQLSDYTKLKSLSIASPRPLLTISGLHTLSFASTLKRLDLCIAPKAGFTLSIPISLPQLEELRIGLREGATRILAWAYSRSILDLCPLQSTGPEEFAVSVPSFFKH